MVYQEAEKGDGGTNVQNRFSKSGGGKAKEEKKKKAGGELSCSRRGRKRLGKKDLGSTLVWVGLAQGGQSQSKVEPGGSSRGGEERKRKELSKLRAVCKGCWVGKGGEGKEGHFYASGGRRDQGELAPGSGGKGKHGHRLVPGGGGTRA